MSGSVSCNSDDTVRSGRETPIMPYTRSNSEQNHSIYEPSRAEALSIPLQWKHAYGKERLEYSEENDELWKILNDLAENERILDNKIALLHEEQRRMFAEARNSNSSANAKLFANVVGSPTNCDTARRLMFDKSSRGGKSRRVFRKKTKTTRRRNKKSNRSHRRRRRTSHVAKQT